MVRWLLIALSALTVSHLPACADRLSDLPPAAEFQGSILRVRHTLAPHRSFSEVIAFVGAPPERCVPVSQQSLICVWALSKREPGWRPLTSALGTGDHLNLVCEFPGSKGPRAEVSCSAHAQRSNRTYYRTLTVGKRGQKKRADWRTESRRSEAQELVDSATTAFELSTLVGDAPDQCTDSYSETHCVWKTDARTYGHGTLAVSIGADFRKKVRLSCSLPVSGAPRDQNSCVVHIGN
jgi:hypothetical protein